MMCREIFQSKRRGLPVWFSEFLECSECSTCRGRVRVRNGCHSLRGAAQSWHTFLIVILQTSAGFFIFHRLNLRNAATLICNRIRQRTKESREWRTLSCRINVLEMGILEEVDLRRDQPFVSWSVFVSATTDLTSNFFDVDCMICRYPLILETSSTLKTNTPRLPRVICCWINSKMAAAVLRTSEHRYQNWRTYISPTKAL